MAKFSYNNKFVWFSSFNFVYKIIFTAVFTAIGKYYLYSIKIVRV